MVKKTKKRGKSNPIAKDLRTAIYKQRLVANTKNYNRKINMNLYSLTNQKSNTKRSLFQ